jgi:peptide deformylase
MAILEVLKMGHPVLRQVATEVSLEEISNVEMASFISDMIETMNQQQGIGLAAPQIGVSKKIAIIRVPTDSQRCPESEQSPLFVLFNPTVKVLDQDKIGCWEGCLSVPNLKGYVERPCKIEVNYLDKNAQAQTFIAEDFLSIVFQHELDHLDGVLYIDKLKSTQLLAFNEEYDQFYNDEENEEN